MPSDSPSMTGSGDVPTVVVQDEQGRELLCYVEETVQLDGDDFSLLSPVDTPVCLFRLGAEDEEPELIETLEASEPILSVADVVLQEHDLTLVRSAVTLTVSGELDEPDPEELEEEEDDDDETESFELLVNFMANGLEYGLYIPLDPFFLVARLQGGRAVLLEDGELERIQPLLEAQLEQRDPDD